MTWSIARCAGCAVIALLLLPAPAPAAFGDRPLREGMAGEDVRVLQVLLTKAGFRLTVDGRFGPRTRRAVGRWESDRERRVDGWMSRDDSLALRREFRRPIDGHAPAREVEAPEGSVRLVRLGDASLAAGESHQALAPGGHAFPIEGRHDLGRSESNRFGGGRGHQGQDMFAGCGTPVRAAQGGTVRFAGYHAAAGNFLVIRGAGSGEDYVYMHLRDAAELAAGDKVTTAERIGAVGSTGRASGCHLHFELWSAPGWYRGGSAYDPRPKLRGWDRWT